MCIQHLTKNWSTYQAERTAELFLSDNKPLDLSRGEKAFVMLSKHMIKTQISGVAAYVQSAEQPNSQEPQSSRNGWLGDKQLERVLLDKLCAETLFRMHSSVIFNVSDSKQAQQIKDDHPLTDAQERDFLLVHGIPVGLVPPKVCLIATTPEQKSSLQWYGLGKAVMSVLNSYSGEVDTLIVPDWGIVSNVLAQRSFLRGMASLYIPGISIKKVAATEPPF